MPSTERILHSQSATGAIAPDRFESCRGHYYNPSSETIDLSQFPPCAIHVPCRGPRVDLDLNIDR